MTERRRWLDALQAAAEHAGRTATDLAVLLLDVDRLRDVNALYGEDAGDAILRAIAGFADGHCRAGDVVARYEGATLAVLLPGASLEGAQGVAEALRFGVAGLRVAAGRHTVRATVSVGVAAWSPAAPSGEAVLHEAGRALGAAKTAGRDCTVVSKRPTYV